MADWISRRVRERGMAISLENAELFLLHAGSDLRHLANEVDKLSVYLGDGADVSADDVRGVVTSSDDQYVWRIFDAAMDGRGNEALRLLEMSLKGSAEPLQIVASLGSTMRETWQARRLLDKGYFKRIGNSYNKMAVADELSKVSKADRDELAADGGIAKPSASAFKLFHAVRRAKRLPLDTIERIMQRLLDIDCKLKGIRRPLPGPEEIILQQLVADLAFVAKRGEGPTRHGRR
jgi:DNA polymerase III delta subunit